MDVFNEVNSRRIADELNVFARLHRSPTFLGVLAVTVGAQVIIVELLGNFFDVEPLSWQEWLVSVALGAASLPLSTAVRLVGRGMRRRHRRHRLRGVDGDLSMATHQGPRSDPRHHQHHQNQHQTQTQDQRQRQRQRAGGGEV
ncbi:hypothetical protein PLESTF_000409500 [Pleodorina starrii]|nr:hypothetical protein PLESTF_000409500 [Pleodorina starrii]